MGKSCLCVCANSGWQVTSVQEVQKELYLTKVKNGTSPSSQFPIQMAVGRYWLGKTRILKYTQFLCQFYALRKQNVRPGVEGCGVVVWFGKYTDIASLVLLFGFTQPIDAMLLCVHAQKLTLSDALVVVVQLFRQEIPFQAVVEVAASLDLQGEVVVPIAIPVFNFRKKERERERKKQTNKERKKERKKQRNKQTNEQQTNKQTKKQTDKQSGPTQNTTQHQIQTLWTV